MNTIDSHHHVSPKIFEAGDKEIFHTHKKTLPAADQVTFSHMTSLFSIETLSSKIERSALPEVPDPYLLNPPIFKNIGQSVFLKIEKLFPNESELAEILKEHQYNEKTIDLNRALLLRG